jgi:hypothetical protein
MQTRATGRLSGGKGRGEMKAQLCAFASGRGQLIKQRQPQLTGCNDEGTAALDIAAFCHFHLENGMIFFCKAAILFAALN